MTNTTLTIKIQHHFVCPNCDDYTFNYTHLCEAKDKPANFKWQCGNCVADISFTINADNGLTLNNVKVPKYPKALLLLKLDTPEDIPLYLVKEQSNYSHVEDIVEFIKHQKFIYEEHTCPSNYLGGNVVIYKGDDDPHGIFKLVDVIWMPEGFDVCEFHNQGRSYTELFKGLII